MNDTETAPGPFGQLSVAIECIDNAQDHASAAITLLNSSAMFGAPDAEEKRAKAARIQAAISELERIGMDLREIRGFELP